MNIPHFWARADGVANNPRGESFDLRAWGWSNSGVAEARDNAQDRLRRILSRVAAGEPFPSRYPYGVGAMREEIVREVAPNAVITRNSYGSLVLNTTDVMFIDIDLPEGTQGGGGLLRSLFGKKADPVAEALQKLKDALTSAARSTFRVYRTAGGFRVMAVERLFEPGSGEAERIMTAVGADPQFVQLCRAQRSFRARLTPKPWRCGWSTPPGEYPREDPAATAKFLAWRAEYERRCATKATCRFVEKVGNGWTSSAIEPLVKLHDDMTRANEALDLA